MILYLNRETILINQIEFDNWEKYDIYIYWTDWEKNVVIDLSFTNQFFQSNCSFHGQYQDLKVLDQAVLTWIHALPDGKFRKRLYLSFPEDKSYKFLDNYNPKPSKNDTYLTNINKPIAVAAKMKNEVAPR